MIDYTINELTNSYIKNAKKESAFFSDLYFFVRAGDRWLLNKIQNNVSLTDIRDAKNYKEV